MLYLPYLTLFFSAVAVWADWTAINPANGELVRPKNLLTEQGIHKILTGMVKNFTDFAPLGIVLVAMLGIGIAEKSGLIDALIRLVISSTPKNL